jgi:flagellar biosynthesis protein FlhA
MSVGMRTDSAKEIHMKSSSSNGLQAMLMNNVGLVFPIMMMMSMLVIVAPLPPFMLDLLIACNITISVMILLTSIQVKNPLEFSVFPALLLGTTLARLVLNVASTRLILTGAPIHGVDAGGDVIKTFGLFVAGGSPTIGVVIFVILVAIQFLVITKGSTRVSEVSARFTLDAMPGKQMAIDADLNAGLITPEQAKKRRSEIAQQADFYGSMDGASKFVRGDAIASIVITLINVLGGIFIGVVLNKMSFLEAVNVFTILTIGDGLVTQVPAFLISIASGLIATRSSVDSNLAGDMVGQLFRHPTSLYMASGFLVCLTFTGLPALPLLGLSIGCIYIGSQIQSENKKVAVKEAVEAQKQTTEPKAPPKPEDHLAVSPMEMELGIGLIRLADPKAGGDLLDRVTKIRNHIAQELGIIMPKVRIRDNLRIGRNSYQIKVRGNAVTGGELQIDKLLAIQTPTTAGNIPGIDTKDPAFGRPAKWIEQSQRERAEMMGYSIVEPIAVLITHLTEIVNEYSNEILSRQQVHELLEHVKKDSPKVVEELVPEMLKVPQVHTVLSNLLKERIPIRDLETILEALTSYADRTKDLGLLTEYVRHALRRTICQQYRDQQKIIHCVMLDPLLEDVLASGFETTERGTIIKLSPQVIEQVTKGIADQLEKLVKTGRPAVIIVNPQIRSGLKQLTSTVLPRLAILSMNEITRETQIEAMGQVPVSVLQTSKAPLVPQAQQVNKPKAPAQVG